MPETAKRANGREEPDEILMARYAAGDLEAFDELYQRYERRAYFYFLKQTDSPQCAEDLFQELFLRIHRARNCYDPERAFAPWFFQIANHLLIDDRRRAFRRYELPIDGHDPPVEQLGSEAQVADREQVDQLLRTLSPQERYVVLEAKVKGIGYSALATRLGKSEDAVKKMASRAIQQLRSAAPPETDLGAPAS